MKVFENAKKVVDKAALDKLGENFPKWEKYKETKQMLSKYQKLATEFIKKNNYPGWETDMDQYLGGTQDLMNEILKDKKVSAKEGEKLNASLNERTGKLYEKLLIKQKEYFEVELLKKEVETQKLVKERKFGKAKKLYENFSKKNNIDKLHPDLALKIKEDILEVSLLEGKFNMFFKSGTVIHGLKGPNYVTGVDSNGNVKLSEFKVVFDEMENKYKDDHIYSMATTGDKSDVPVQINPDIPDEPPTSFTNFKLVLKKGKNKVNWMDLLKEIENKNYKAREIQKSVESNLVIDEFNNYENVSKEKKYPDSLNEEILDVQVAKMLVQVKTFYKNPQLDLLPEEDRPLMKAAIEENYTQYGLFFKENPNNPKDKFFPTILFKKGKGMQKISILNGLLNNHMEIFKRLKFEKQIEDPKEDPIKKDYYRAEVDLQNQDYINAYAHFKKYLNQAGFSEGGHYLQNSSSRKSDEIKRSPLKNVRAKVQMDKGYLELKEKCNEGLKKASIGILNMAENVINNVPMKPEKRKNFGAYKIINKLRNLINKGKANSLHDAFDKLDLGQEVDADMGSKNNFNFDNLVRRIVTLTEVENDKKRKDLFEDEALKLLRGRNATTKQIQRGDNFINASVPNYWTHASQAFLSGVKRGETTKMLRKWHKNSDWLDIMRGTLDEKKGFMKNYNSVNALMMKKVKQVLYTKGKAKEIKDLIKSITNENGEYIPGELRLPKNDDGLKQALFIVASGGLAGFLGRGATTFVTSRLASFAEQGLIRNLTTKLVAETAGLAVEAPAFEALMTGLQVADQGGGLNEMMKRFTFKGVKHSFTFLGSMKIVGMALNPLAKFTRMFRKIPPAELSKFQKLTQNLFPNAIHMAGSAGVMSYFSNTSFINNLAQMPLYHFGGAKFRKLFGNWEKKAQLKAEIAKMQGDVNPITRGKAKLLNEMLSDKKITPDKIELYAGLSAKQIAGIKELTEDPAYAGYIVLIRESIKQNGHITKNAQSLQSSLIGKLKKFGISEETAKKIINSIPVESILFSKELIKKRMQALREGSKLYKNAEDFLKNKKDKIKGYLKNNSIKHAFQVFMNNYNGKYEKFKKEHPKLGKLLPKDLRDLGILSISVVSGVVGTPLALVKVAPKEGSRSIAKLAESQGINLRTMKRPSMEALATEFNKTNQVPRSKRQEIAYTLLHKNKHGILAYNTKGKVQYYEKMTDYIKEAAFQIVKTNADGSLIAYNYKGEKQIYKTQAEYLVDKAVISLDKFNQPNVTNHGIAEQFTKRINGVEQTLAKMPDLQKPIEVLVKLRNSPGKLKKIGLSSPAALKRFDAYIKYVQKVQAEAVKIQKLSQSTKAKIHGKEMLLSKAPGLANASYAELQAIRKNPTQLKRLGIANTNPKINEANFKAFENYMEIVRLGKRKGTKDMLDSLMNDIAGKVKPVEEGVDLIGDGSHQTGNHQAPVKKIGRTMEKALDPGEYNGNASKLLDIARGSLEYGTLPQIRHAVEALKRHPKVAKIFIKDNFGDPLKPNEHPAQYRDMNISIKFKDGRVAELQFHISEMLKVKEQGMNIPSLKGKLKFSQREHELAAEIAKRIGKEGKLKLPTGTEFQTHTFYELWRSIPDRSPEQIAGIKNPVKRAKAEELFYFKKKLNRSQQKINEAAWEMYKKRVKLK